LANSRDNPSIAGSENCDWPLSKEGKQQSRALGNYLGTLNIKYISTSPFRRTLETAEILCEILSLSMEVNHNLAEYFSHEDKRLQHFHGLSKGEILDHFTRINFIDIFPENNWWPTWPESEIDFIERIIACITESNTSHDLSTMNILFVTHGAFLEYLYKHIRGKKPVLPQCSSLTTLEIDTESNINILDFGIIPYDK